MRLINTATLEFETFSNDPFDIDFPRYAILSHTWEVEEVTFQDMHDLDVARKKRGFGKIARCCEIALEEGLQWAWIGTCCINKDTSAELEEGHRDWRRSRWFKRGWTLQELIAPFEVVLYDRDWNELGTKRCLTSELGELTRIPEEVLLDPEARLDVSIARRMSWAKGRETTRPEDGAYCLLGVFAINIGLLYGEGTLAFNRLHEELLKLNDDTLFLGGLTSIQQSDRTNWAVRPPISWLAHHFLVTPDTTPCILQGEIKSLRQLDKEWGVPPEPGLQYGPSRLIGEHIEMLMPMVKVDSGATISLYEKTTWLYQLFLWDQSVNAAMPGLMLYPTEKFDGLPAIYLGMLRCGLSREKKYLARYFICRENENGWLDAHPTSFFCYSPRAQKYGTMKQCRVFHKTDRLTPWPSLDYLRDTRTWDAESPRSGVFDNGWQWKLKKKLYSSPTVRERVFPVSESESYNLSFDASVWRLTINLSSEKWDWAGPALARYFIHLELRLQPPDATAKPFVGEAKLFSTTHRAQAAQLRQRVPVAGGSAELWITMHHGLQDKNHCYRSLIRFRGFRPGEPQQAVLPLDEVQESLIHASSKAANKKKRSRDARKWESEEKDSTGKVVNRRVARRRIAAKCG
ncbi:heterokaryon incompatibility protein-domain-containing protein [Xylariaceae sp. FL0594]|nr:heterokaryon incompatibility protein-domain-containing protein [Xylariaceae sp. FL0594]